MTVSKNSSEDLASLFREEALNARAKERHSSVILQKHSLLNWLACLFVLLLLASAYGLMAVSYRETESAFGTLQLSSGTQKLTAPVNGTILEVLVGEGEETRPGQVLAQISTTVFNEDGKTLQHALLQELAHSRENLKSRYRIQQVQQQQRTHFFELSLQQARDKLAALTGEQSLLQSQLLLAQESEQRMAHLLDKGAIARMQSDQAQVSRLHLQREQARLEATRTETEAAINKLEFDAKQLLLDGRNAQLLLDQELLRIDTELAQLSDKQVVAVVSHSPGTVSAVAIHPGMPVQQGQVLLHLGSSRESLLAEMFVTSRIAGLLEPGRRIMLRYDAFDFREYGRFGAVVTQVGHSGLDARETPLPLFRSSELRYRVLAALDQQSVDGIYRLTPGMAFQADFILQEMSLLDFMLQPFAALRGKVQWQRAQNHLG